MKHTLTFVLAFMATAFISKAQLYLGGKAGLNFANVTGSFIAPTTFNTKIGLNGGVTLKYNFINTFGLQMDVLYSKMGSNSKNVTVYEDEIDGLITTETTEKIYDFTYLQVPLYVNWEIPINSEQLTPYRASENIFSIHVTGGGFFGYGLANMNSTTIKTTTIDVDGNTEILPTTKASGANKGFSPIDFGAIFGVGFSFKLSDVGRITLDGRYLLGLGNFNSTAYRDESFPSILPIFPVMQNRAPQVQIGYIHRITKPKRW